MLTSSRNSAKIRKMNNDGIPLFFKLWFGFIIIFAICIFGIIGWTFLNIIHDPIGFGHDVGHVIGSTIGGIKEGIKE